MSHIAVIDIGKTNAKLALVDSHDLTEIAVITRPNIVLPGPPWPHFDLDGIWRFLLNGLTRFNTDYGIEAISVTTHGASIILLTTSGELAAPMLDYEHDIPDVIAAEYDQLRPDFSQTGSPRLSGGLNVGAQLHYMFHVDPALKARTRQIVTYPQYWSFLLTGIATTEVTSLGCHTDLWNPFTNAPSSLVENLGITDKLAPVQSASDVLGSLRPEIADATGLPSTVRVTCGIHDSNASLLPHLLARKTPFSVVSTGTWVIAMSVGGDANHLDPARDTLINIDAMGNTVPSARFMGGREHDLLLGSAPTDPSHAQVQEILDNDIMLLPAVVTTSGPFQGHKMHWHGTKPETGTGQKTAAVGFYLALMTAECLWLTGQRGASIVEGPFARNTQYLEMLAAATNAPVIASSANIGTSQGAAQLITGPRSFGKAEQQRIEPDQLDALRSYAKRWRAQIRP